MERIEGIDAVRTIAIIAVIALHTTPFQQQSSSIGAELDFAILINQCARFAVPFFFVISGYFWANKFSDEAGLMKVTRDIALRVLMLFSVWSVIYLLPTNIMDAHMLDAWGLLKHIYWRVVSALTNPQITLVQGTKSHLWFLASLFCCLIISAACLRIGSKRLLVVLAATAYLAGLAGKAYADTPLGFHSNFNFRNGPFFALAFFSTGYFIQRQKVLPSISFGLALAILGALLQFFELFVLNSIWGTSMEQDFVVGTYFLGCGVSFLALANAKWLRSHRLASIGPRVLGIYAAHYIFVDLLTPIDRKYAGSAIWDLSYVATVFLLSYALTAALSRHDLARRFVQ